jgi:DnaJ-class molecular chaperone
MSAAPHDLYVVLGVPREATAAEIAHAYRALVRRHHPDTRSQAGSPPEQDPDRQLQQVQEAYAVLGDPRARAAYDRRTRLGNKPTHDEANSELIREAPPGQPPVRGGPIHWQPPPGA